MNEERIREEIAIRLHTVARTTAKVICEDSPINESWEDLDEHWREHYRELAVQILSIKGIRLMEKKMICVLCGRDWEPYMNRCECGGMCSWGHEMGKPSSWTVNPNGSWTPKPPSSNVK